MTTRGLARLRPTPHLSIRPLEPEPPAWVSALLRLNDDAVCPARLGHFELLRRDPFVRLTTRIVSAIALEAEELSAQVTDRYQALDAALITLGHHPLRLWNYVPGIVDRVGQTSDRLDRYMAFNRGRFIACTTPSEQGRFQTGRIPTASAVGIGGPDLVIDCLASTSGGTPVDNPRQTESWRYSRRYGPRPPYFARGTRTEIDGRAVLLLGGTASICGEESRHPGEVEAQLDEILINLRALIAKGLADHHAEAEEAAAAGDDAIDADPLNRLSDVRIYVVDPEDAELVESTIARGLDPAARVECAIARVCRPELLVEVEGVATLGG